MKLNFIGLSVIALLLLACSHGQDMFLMKRDEVLTRYAGAIRWGEWEKAAQFQEPARRTRLDLAWLKTIHIATYNPVFLQDDPKSKIVEQTVEIRYFIEPFGSEKTLTDRQLWRFDEELDRWTLDSDLPAFR